MHFTFFPWKTALGVLLGVPLLFAGTANAQQDPLSSTERGKLDGELQIVLDRQKTQAKAKTADQGIALPSMSTVSVGSEGTPRYSVIVHTDDPAALRAAGIEPNSVLDGFATAHVTRDQLRALAQTATVTRVESSTKMEPTNDEAAREVGARTLNSGAVNDTNYEGQDVISCVIDTGIDYDHGDFYRSDGTTRILRIWDQPDTNDSTGTGHPNNFDYGAEYTEPDITAGNVSEEDVNGHGTHVAGTMAGSGNELVLDGTQSEPEHRGMAPKSDVVMVKTAFGSAEIIDGMNYCHQVATDEGKPVVINMSLGGHNVPHDGTGTVAQAVDLITGAGTIAVAAAGNEGGQPIHTSGTVASGDASTESWTVGSYSPFLGTSNDLFLTTFWIDGTNDLQVIVRSPGDTYADTLDASGSGTVATFKDTTDGAIYIESGSGSTNGDRYFDVQVYDNTSGQEPAEGTWDIAVTNSGSSSTTYHGWTYTQTVPGSFDDGDGTYSVGSPATAASAVTVGSYVHRWRWSSSGNTSYAYDGSSDDRDDISGFSSRGPLRDGSLKPDVAAPGQGMISALSLDKPNPTSSRIVTGGKHRMVQGTSMASPTVAGAVALLLQEDGSLTPSEIKTHLADNARVDGSVVAHGSPPNTAFGAGKLDVLAAMTDLLGGTPQREILSYDDPWTSSSSESQTVGGGAPERIALRFTPNTDGFVTGVLFNLGPAPAHNLSGPLNVEVWSDDGSGTPDSKLGNTVQVDTSQLKDFSPTAVNLVPASAEVVSGTDYHLVLSPSTASDTIDVAYETAGSASGRSQTYDGSSWSGVGGDFVIRPEVARTHGVSGKLPVEMAAFSGVTDGSAVTLTWSTAGETNNAGFRLQHRAPEDSSFSRVAFVEGGGTTQDAQTYRHTLDDLAPGSHTFRLRQVDVDGTGHTGPETTVSVGMQAPYSVSPVAPNPVRDRGTVSVTVQETQEVRAAIYNVIGQQVALLHDGSMPARDPTTLNVGSNLQSGVYFLRVEGEAFTTTKKFVRVR